MLTLGIFCRFSGAGRSVLEPASSSLSLARLLAIIDDKIDKIQLNFHYAQAEASRHVYLYSTSSKTTQRSSFVVHGIAPKFPGCEIEP